MAHASIQREGRILRPRQFVPVPDFLTQPHDWLDSNGIPRRWVCAWPHPELADLARRLSNLFEIASLSATQAENIDHVECILKTARDYYAWWFDQMQVERLLPDSPCRPRPNDIKQRMPSWDSFVLILGAIHRCRDWVERLERKHGISQPRLQSAIHSYFGVDG